MPITGYTDNLPDEVLNAPAVLYRDVTGVPTLWGVTREGVEWDPEATLAEIEFDGKRHTYVKGLGQVTKYGGKLTATLIQIGTDAQMLTLSPGATSAAGTPPVTKVITPKAAGTLFAAADYQTNIEVVWQLNDGSFFEIFIPCAYVKMTMKSAAEGQAEASVEIYAVADYSGGNTSAAPFKYQTRSALPA